MLQANIYGPVLVIKDFSSIISIARQAQLKGFFLVELMRFDLPQKGVAAAVGLASFSAQQKREILEEEAKKFIKDITQTFHNKVYVVQEPACNFVMMTSQDFVQTNPEQKRSSFSPSL